MVRIAVLGFDEFVAGIHHVRTAEPTAEPSIPTHPSRPACDRGAEPIAPQTAPQIAPQIGAMYAIHYHRRGEDIDAIREYFSDRRLALCRMLVLASCNYIDDVFIDEFLDVDGEFECRSRRVVDDVKVDAMFDRLSLSDLEAVTTSCGRTLLQ
jgi:hypothetical protein